MSLSICRIVLAQAVVILVGFLILGLSLKVTGYPDETFVEYTWSAKFLRSCFWFIPIVPALWAIFAGICVGRNRGIWTEGVSLVAGIGIAVLILFWFVHTAIFPIKKRKLFRSVEIHLNEEEIRFSDRA